MRKIIQYLNVTPHSFCDHTVVNADDLETISEIHEISNELMRNSDFCFIWKGDVSTI